MDLTDQDSHFAFGENWQSFAETVDENKVDESILGMRRLLPEGLDGKTFLDIGCGSGLSMVAASRLGAAELTGTDIDPASVATTKALLDRFGIQADVSHCSVFDLPDQQYDVVYSWGVLHHTGDMWKAIEKAGTLVKPGGLLAIAIYQKSHLCPVWKVEKRVYSQAPKSAQYLIASIYAAMKAVFHPMQTIKKPISRGMDWNHDTHDWLGGYPYESATPNEIRRFLSKIGLKTLSGPEGDGKTIGLFGTGCLEYTAKHLHDDVTQS